MTDRILVVTDPDDTLLQGIRIAHVQLTPEQSQAVSDALLATDLPCSVINYVWKMGDSTTWFFDKIAKCDLIIFNADAPNELITGWAAAQHRSYYFGTLKDLHIVNDRAIYNVDSISTLLEKTAKNYD